MEKSATSPTGSWVKITAICIKILSSHLEDGFGRAGLFCNYSPIFAIIRSLSNKINGIKTHQIGTKMAMKGTSTASFDARAANF